MKHLKTTYLQLFQNFLLLIHSFRQWNALFFTTPKITAFYFLVDTHRVGSILGSSHPSPRDFYKYSLEYTCLDKAAAAVRGSCTLTDRATDTLYNALSGDRTTASSAETATSRLLVSIRKRLGLRTFSCGGAQ